MWTVQPISWFIGLGILSNTVFCVLKYVFMWSHKGKRPTTTKKISTAAGVCSILKRKPSQRREALSERRERLAGNTIKEKGHCQIRGEMDLTSGKGKQKREEDQKKDRNGVIIFLSYRPGQKSLISSLSWSILLSRPPSRLCLLHISALNQSHSTFNLIYKHRHAIIP